MILEKVLVLGERLDLAIEDMEYKSSVQDIIDQTTFLVANPLDGRNLPIHMEMDSTVAISFYRDNGRFQFRAQVLGRARINDITLVRLKALKGDPVKVQRRNSFRLQKSVSVLMRPLNPSIKMKEQYQQHTADIGEGGILVYFEDMVPVDTAFLLEIVLDEEDMEPIRMRGIVRRLVPPESSRALWKLGIEFAGMLEADRRRISLFVLRSQVNSRANRQ